MKAQFTPLYKRLRNRMNAEERREFVRELQKCIDQNGWRRNADPRAADYARRVTIDAEDVNMCFVWNFQPQRHHYWEAVHHVITTGRHA